MEEMTMRTIFRMFSFLSLVLSALALSSCGTEERVHVEDIVPDDGMFVVVYSDGTQEEITIPDADGTRGITGLELDDDDRLIIRFTDKTSVTLQSYADARPVESIAVEDDRLVVTHTDGSSIEIDVRFTYRTVNFKDAVGALHYKQLVPHGEDAYEIEPPTKTGHDFLGWDVDLEDITKNLVVKPLFEAISYTVDFITGMEPEPDPIEVTHGDILEIPALEKEGHVLEGIYKDEGLNKPYREGEPVTSDMTLHFHWIELKTTVYDEELLKEVMNLLLNWHYKGVGEETLYEGALRGMIRALDDPYTTYMTPEEAERFSEGLGEDFVGIGVAVENVDDNVVVRKVWSDSPAEEAGLLPGDVVTHVDGEDVRPFSFTDTLLKLLGEEGTSVEVGVSRTAVPETLFFTMVRTRIPNPSAEYEVVHLDDKTVGYLKINSFGSATPGIVEGALDHFEDEIGIDGLIIDVRNNSGGYLHAVRRIADMFLPAGDLPLFYAEIYEYPAQWASGTETKPYDILTLINGGSASASEVLAGALMEKGGYDALGTPTFGKGTIQGGVTLSTGSTLNLTYARWLTPEANWIHEGEGDYDHIAPTIHMEQNPLLRAHSIFLPDGEALVFDTVGIHNENAQRILKALGHDVRTDGYYGECTVEAVETYQDEKGLPVTGEIDSTTAKSMNEAYLAYRTDRANDTQFQKALEYFLDE